MYNFFWYLLGYYTYDKQEKEEVVQIEKTEQIEKIENIEKTENINKQKKDMIMKYYDVIQELKTKLVLID